jgi:hypothetical protein
LINLNAFALETLSLKNFEGRSEKFTNVGLKYRWFSDRFPYRLYVVFGYAKIQYQGGQKSAFFSESSLLLPLVTISPFNRRNPE